VAWRTTDDLDEFVAAAGDFLRARPVENTILLTVVEQLAARKAPAAGRFGWWRSDGGVAGAFLRTPPYPAVLTGMPDEAVVPLLDAAGLDAVNAGSAVAAAVAAEWRRRTGAEAEVHRRIRLYRLGELAPPDPPPGRPRATTPADRDLLLSWYGAFVRELDEPSGDLVESVDDRLGYGGLTLWEVDGVPVSMAGRTRASAGMVRIGPVYTPVELRKRGYAGAVTAAVSRAAQGLAGDVLLFTDLANAGTNSLYQRLGYRHVDDRLVLSIVG
jgi:FR47-like protein